MSGDEHPIFALTLNIENRRLVGRTRDVSRRMGRMLDGLLGCEPTSRNELTFLPSATGTALVVRGRRVCDGFVLPQVVAVLTFLDPGSCVLPDATLLQSAFALTASEAGVALGIAAGQTLREIAAARGIAVPTVRSHLKSVFGKTQTHRQSALVALLLSLQTPGAPGGGRRSRLIS